MAQQHVLNTVLFVVHLYPSQGRFLLDISLVNVVGVVVITVPRWRTRNKARPPQQIVMCTHALRGPPPPRGGGGVCVLAAARRTDTSQL